MTEEELKKEGWLSPEEVAKVQDGWKIYEEYAMGYISFQKIRTGNLELTEKEKEIRPKILEAKVILRLMSQADAELLLK